MANVMEQLLVDTSVRDEENLNIVAADSADSLLPWQG